jgi:hypothetical protein
MKKMFLLNLALGLLILPLHAQNVWSSKIETFGNYVNQPINPHANGVVSVFTPATDVTVNRIQVQVAGGTVCGRLPGIRVTDGTTSFTVPIPNMIATDSDFGPVSADSGVISLAYTAGTRIAVLAVPGSAGCNPFEINISVQYSAGSTTP